MLLSQIEQRADSLGELMEAFRNYRCSLQNMLENNATENKMGEADKAVGVLFDKIISFKANNDDEKTAMINFSLNMIEELTEDDSMIKVHTGLLRQYI